MTEIEERLLAERFPPLRNPVDDSDWLDVMRRARDPVRRRRRLLAIGIAAALLVAATTALALGWPGAVIDFFSAKPAPKRVVVQFGRLNVISAPGMSPRTIPGQAREVMSAVLNGKRHRLYLAPTRDGGFCFIWSNWIGGCANRKLRSVQVPGQPRRTVVPPKIGVSYEDARQNGVPHIVTGHVFVRDADRLELRFADGTRTSVPVTWVSPPIDAGFFIYEIPAAHLRRSTALTAVVAVRSDGSIAAQARFHLPSPLDREVVRGLPDGSRISLPLKAEAAKARKPISFRAENGSEVWLWVMPSRTGGRCYVYNQGGGCTPDHPVKGELPMMGGFSIGGRRVLFFAQTKPSVAKVEFRYQDGSRETITPTEGFVLHEIGSRHYPRGHRLVDALALSSTGKTLFRQPFDPQQPGVYPCYKPIPRGYGIKSCP
jgi:hypothetical protein